MAYELHRNAYPGLAASAINSRVPVGRAAGERAVVPVATSGAEPFGISLASAAQGEAVTVLDHHSVAKAVAAASLGGGAPLGVASTNGALGPIAGASGVARFQVGISEHAAAAGEVVSVFVNPRQLSGLV